LFSGVSVIAGSLRLFASSPAAVTSAPKSLTSIFAGSTGSPPSGAFAASSSFCRAVA
jgi:hypothetical protein